MKRHAECRYDSPDPAGSFSRLCRKEKGHQLDRDILWGIASAMTQGSGQDSDVPAGYTYLGQFVAHDLSFDPRLLGDAPVPASEMEQRRSPSLDLDSLYGRGPDADPRFYCADKVRLRLDATSSVAGRYAGKRPALDLPREDGCALIPDPRNDENLVVAQTHVAFSRFHNAVVDELENESPPPEHLFDAARELVVRHYHWMLRWDFLPRLTDVGQLAEVFGTPHGRKVVQPRAKPGVAPTMPLEFSAAAFRLGHSMVRNSYFVNRRVRDQPLGALFDHTGSDTGSIHQGENLPSSWVVDFRHFYDVGDTDPEDANRARRIDTLLSPGLAELPEGAILGPQASPERELNLAFRNLTRASGLHLATGQQMLRRMNAMGVTSIAPLSAKQIRTGRDGADLSAVLSPSQLRRVALDTPLWFYVLREAELNCGRMTGVGGRLLAETFHRCIEGSRLSMIGDDPPWTPCLVPDGEEFGMVDLLRFAFDKQLDPLPSLSRGP